MATTTATAMRTAFETIILALTPAGTAHGRAAFQKASPHRSWDQRSKSDIDREFTIDDIKLGEVLEFGINTEYDYNATMMVTIGHAITGDANTGIGRREDDVMQIAEALHKKTNYPSGVHLVIPNGSSSTVENEKFWITIISFRLKFTRSV